MGGMGIGMTQSDSNAMKLQLPQCFKPTLQFLLCGHVRWQTTIEAAFADGNRSMDYCVMDINSENLIAGK